MVVRHRLPSFPDDIPKADVFNAHGTEFVIPGATVGGIPFRTKVKTVHIKEEFKWSQVRSSWNKFWSKFRTRVWFMFVEALWIPSYRPEWGKYKTWKYSYGKTKKDENKKPVTSTSEHGRAFDIWDTSRDSSISSAEGRQKMSQRKFQRRRTIDSILDQRAIRRPSQSQMVPHDTKGCEILRFNISGLVYETERRTLTEFPETLLGSPEKLKRYWDPTRHEYFFDRHRRSFEAILYFFQSRGTLIRPADISLPVFEDEIKFYELGSTVHFHYLQDEGIMSKDDLAKGLPGNLLLRKLWFLFEYPESSKQAQITALFSVFVVILSTVSFCIETLSAFNVNDLMLTKTKDPFFLCESVCVIWFTLELLVRVVACPDNLEFLAGPMNIIDVVSIIPYYITVFTPVSEDPTNSNDAASTLVTLRIFRLFRVFRIFKLSRHSAGLKVLGKTLRASVRELGLLVFFLLVCVVIFASLVYFAELTEESRVFTSIPDAFWWGIVTMTTLGYGDQIPITLGGRIVCSLCAVAAVLTLALPIPVFVSNFNYFYQRETQEEGRKEMAHHVEGCSFLPDCPVMMGRDTDVEPKSAAESEEARQRTKRETRMSLRLSAPPVLRSREPAPEKERK